MDKVYIIFECERHVENKPIKVFLNKDNAGAEIKNLEKKNRDCNIWYDYEEFPIEDLL